MSTQKVNSAVPSAPQFGSNALMVRKDAGGTGADSTAYVEQLQGSDDGRLRVDTEVQRPVFDAPIVGLVPVASATDIITIYGSATKTIGIREIKLNGIATAALNTGVFAIRRSTANAGGTSATVTPKARDKGNDTVASTAVVTTYTGNATALGATSVTGNGTITADNIFLNVATGASQPLVMRFDPPLLLSGTASGLCINLGAVSVGGGVINGCITFDERPTTA